MIILLTIWVLEHPWGPTLWLLGPCSLGHGPFLKVLKRLVFEAVSDA